MATSPHLLEKLLNLLEKPNSLDIAEKMIRNWTNKKPIERITSSSTSCMCSILRESVSNVSPSCQSFHWNCALTYLTRKTTRIYNENIIVCTQFSQLTEHVKIQFLNLLINIHTSLPNQSLVRFIDEIQNELQTETWSYYLLNKLKTIIGHSQRTSRSLSPNTVKSIRSLLSFGDQSNEERPNDDSTTVSRKRKVIELIEEDTPQAKHVKLSLSGSPLREELSTTSGKEVGAVDMNQVEEEGKEKDEHSQDLPTNIQLIVDSIKDSWSKGQKAPNDQFSFITTLPSLEFDKCMLYLESTTEQSTMAAICNMIDEIDMNIHYQVSCIRHLITPHFMALQKPVLRQVLTSLLTVIKKYPLSSVDGLLCPLLLLGQSFNSYHGGLVCKLLQQMTDEQRNYLWRKLASNKERVNGELFIWSDHLIKVLQTIIDKGVSFGDPTTIVSFIKLLQVNAGHHTGSLSFASLVVTLLTKHCQEFKAHKSVIVHIIEGNRTVLKKKLLTLTKDIV